MRNCIHVAVAVLFFRIATWVVSDLMRSVKTLLVDLIFSPSRELRAIEIVEIGN